ncbi:AraC family transcriptional regulator [Aliiglaciecola lipolytica]|uniref:AraC family regulatory protein n=1 Tax=Aliiglaciecola lipolytica E3 TaxID=1127673 RepID=K6Y493_9ALTE|nr:AraC family transcriptional regulator [Aliiglaciecola lipolytica]GAC13082.1 AraC family regulatory protein [Aliiglaciecola lipolytica E3]
MQSTLSIRAYSRQKVQHAHDFNQLVLPLRGVINIAVGDFNGKVTPGECVVVKSSEVHQFTADSEARFVVADMHFLPDNLLNSSTRVFTINQPLFRFLSFLEAQLEYQVNKDLEETCFATFYALLGEQRIFKLLDRRIREVIAYVEANFVDVLTINTLANVACLSPTQFKKLFKQQIGLTASQYLVKFRMEKAQALLIHTDSPVQIVAEQVGYTDYTAFSRRFTQYFGLPPSKIAR